VNVKKIFFGLMTTIMLLSLGSVGVGATEKKSNIKINKIDFYVENIHPSYWDADDEAKTRLHYNFFIYIENLKEVIDQISVVKVFDQHDNSWTIDPKKQLDLEKGFVGGRERWYNYSFTDESTLIAIKDLKVVVTLVDGSEVVQSFSIPEPGMLNCTKNYVYSEGYRGKISPNHVQALKLAEIKEAKLSKNILTVNFAVNDKRVSNGYLALLDKDKKYIGSSDWFVKEVSKEIMFALNKGKDLYINNKTNVLQLINTQIGFEEEKTISDARYVLIYLYDGLQFDNTKDAGSFYYISVSELKPIKF